MYFLKSDRRILLLTGTHQNEKHKLVLQGIATTVYSPSSILFRVNNIENVAAFLNEHTTKFQTGTPYILGRHTLFIDPITSSSWVKTKNNYDFAVLYSVDSVLKAKKIKRS